MTRPLSDLLRDVTTALAGYSSLKHTQSKFPQHPGIQAALLEEVAYIEALEREVRAAAQAEAEGHPLLRDALERLLASYCVENAFGDDMCPKCREDAEYVHGPGHGEGCPVPIIRAALNVLAAADHGPLECTQVLKDLGGLRVMVPMLLDTVSGERFVAPDVAEVAHNVTQALRAREDAQVMVPREVVENLLAGWDEGLWGPETQDAGVPDRIVGLIDALRAAHAQAGAESGACQFEQEWAALPAGEGVLASGESALSAAPVTPERLERAAAFMRRLEES